MILKKETILIPIEKTHLLRKANDAIELDTTNLTIDAQVEHIVNKVKLITTGN